MSAPPPTPRVSRSLRRPGRERYHAGPWLPESWPLDVYDGPRDERGPRRFAYLTPVTSMDRNNRSACFHGKPWGCAA